MKCLLSAGEHDKRVYKREKDAVHIDLGGKEV